MLITDKTKTLLLNNVEARLTELTVEVDKLKRLHSQLETYQKFLNDGNIEYSFRSLKKLLNFRLIVGIINLDLCAATLIYLRGKFQYEAIYSSRQIIVIISEGYKKLYNFVIENENGDKILKYRNNSFWIKEVSNIVSEDLPEFKTQYGILTQKLDDYLNINFETLKTQRDLSIHYDKEPIKVYKMLSNIDIEKTFKKLIPFLDILNEMFLFTTELTKGLYKKTELANQNYERKINEIADLLGRHKTTQNAQLIEEFKEQIVLLKNFLIK